MEENMGDPEGISLLRDSGLPQPIGNSPSLDGSEVKYYMTDIVIERILDTTERPSSTITQMNVELVSDVTPEGETLLFEQISSSEWKYDRIIELKRYEVTFKDSLDDMGRVGSVNLGKTEVEKLKSIVGPTDAAHNFLIEQEAHPTFRLKFQLVSIPLDGNYSEETFKSTIKKDSERFFAMVRHLPDLTTNKPIFLDACGDYFFECFKKSQSKDDVDNSILAHRLALQLTPAEPAALPEFLDGSGITNFVGDNHLRGHWNDTDQMVANVSIIEKTESGINPESAARLNRLGVSLIHRFVRFSDATDIIEAVLLQQKAVRLTPEGHADMPIYLNNLALSLRERFLDTGKLKDISEAISLQRKSIQLTPEGHADMPARLSNLGYSLQQQFVHTGEFTDISEAISLQRKSIQLTPEGHAHIPDQLSNLAVSLQQQFSLTGELTDISEAISFQRKLVQLTPEGHADMPAHIANLGASLRERFSHTEELTDISEAISLQWKSIQLTPEGHANIPACLSNLGASLEARFWHTEELTDISEAITCQRKSIQLTTEGHAHMPDRLSNLAVSLRQRFLHTGELTDISEAISLQRKSIQLTPEGHAEMPARLSDLGHSLQQRFLHTGELTDIQAAISQHSLAANSISGSPAARLIASKAWATFSRDYDPSQLLDAHRTAIHLISYIAGLEKTIEKRHNDLIDISTLSSSAAAVAFASERFDLALEWLEQGRCLVWSQLNDLRTPLEALRSHAPRIADEIMSVSRALENAGGRGELSISIAEATMLHKSSLQDEVTAHAKLAQRWDQLLAMVRSISGFEDFLKPPSASTLLRNLPNSGVVIVINVHQDRCDALALRSGIDPLHIPLPELSYDKVDSLRNALKMNLQVAGVRMRESQPDGTRGMRYGAEHRTSLKEILSTLWISVVWPILDSLGYLEPLCDLTRIWWCATGPLAFLPLHAAEIYNESRPETTLALSDFALSSYTPTVRALVDIAKSPRKFDEEKSGLFMISQPDTPYLNPIPGTTREVRAVERQLKSRNLRVLCLEGAAATVDQGIMNMKGYSSIHFACHAMQDTKKPLKSNFALYDGRLKLSTIIQQHLVDADFAFLSACQTSAGDEMLSEEAVHLAAGMLAAGYRGAVATMWSIRDEYGPIIAEDFYSNLTQDSEVLSGEYAARALHYATQNLRKSLGYSELALLAWVPYVHFGL